MILLVKALRTQPLEESRGISQGHLLPGDKVTKDVSKTFLAKLLSFPLLSFS